VAVLQVKLEPEQLEKLKAYSKQRGQTMTQLVSAWVNGLGRGGSEKAAEAAEPAVGTAEPVMVSTTLADLSSEELVVLGRRQVELLEQLVAIAEKPAIPVAMPAVGTAAMPVVLPEEVLAEHVTEAIPAPPAPVEAAVVRPAVPAPAVEAEATEPAPAPAEPAPVVPAPAPAEVEAEDLLAAQRARQLAELESWRERYGAEVAAANRAEAAAAMEAAMPSDAPAVKRKASNPEFLEKLKAAAAAAEADADTPMGASQVDDLTEGVSLDDTPERAEGSGTTAVEVLAPADEGPILADASAGDGDLLKRVEELEQRERLLENWLADIRAGGDPVAPPLPASASEQEWEAAANDCLEARGKKPLPELITAVLKHWGRG